MQRRTFIKRAGLTAGVIGSVPFSATNLFSGAAGFSPVDLHVHRADGFESFQ